MLEIGKGEGSARQKEEFRTPPWGLDSVVYFFNQHMLHRIAAAVVDCQLTSVSTVMQEEAQGKRKFCFAFLERHGKAYRVDSK